MKFLVEVQVHFHILSLSSDKTLHLCKEIEATSHDEACGLAVSSLQSMYSEWCKKNSQSMPPNNKWYNIISIKEVDSTH